MYKTCTPILFIALFWKQVCHPWWTTPWKISMWKWQTKKGCIPTKTLRKSSEGCMKLQSFCGHLGKPLALPAQLQRVHKGKAPTRQQSAITKHKKIQRYGLGKQCSLQKQFWDSPWRSLEGICLCYYLICCRHSSRNLESSEYQIHTESTMPYDASQWWTMALICRSIQVHGTSRSKTAKERSITDKKHKILIMMNNGRIIWVIEYHKNVYDHLSHCVSRKCLLSSESH